MKKFFLFAAAIVAAMTVNAAVWDFTKDTLNTKEAVEAFASKATFKLEQKTASEGNPYVAVNYDLAESAVAELVLDEGAPINLTLSYKNSSAKTEVFKFYNSYLQLNRKGAKIAIACTEGDKINIYPKSYSKACEFAVTGADKEVIALEANSDAVVSVTAKADEVLFDSSTPSSSSYAQACQISKITVGEAETAIDNINEDVKAQKFFENGQLVIIKNGVRYNALGAQL